MKAGIVPTIITANGDTIEMEWCPITQGGKTCRAYKIKITDKNGRPVRDSITYVPQGSVLVVDERFAPQGCVQVHDEEKQ